MYPSDAQAQVLPQKPLTVAEQERLLRVGLPTELWKEVIRHAASIEHEFEPCGFDGMNYTFEYSALYKTEWYHTFQTRLSLVLVCKFWNNLASEYLYRSILIPHARSARQFVRLVLQLANNGMIKYVQRVSVYPSNGSDALQPFHPNAMAQFPNLRVVDTRNYGIFIPEANQIHITTLRAPLGKWSTFEALAFLPHLQYLQCSFGNRHPIGSRVKLGQLKTLHVELYLTEYLLYESLDLPTLDTLIFRNIWGTFQLSLVQHFLPHIRVLGLDLFMKRLPPINPSAPHLKSFICREPFGTNWECLSFVVPFKSIEEVHLSLEAGVLYTLVAPRSSYYVSSMLAHMEDESVVPKLSYVYTDLTPNTLRVMEAGMKDNLRNWLTVMKKREVTVMTYIKTSKYTGHRYCSLEEAWDAEPHWEFWAPTISDRSIDIRRWDFLAEVAGRNNMTWEFSKDGSECQWFGGLGELSRVSGPRHQAFLVDPHVDSTSI